MAIYTGVWWDHASHKLILTLAPKAAGFLSAAIVTWVNLVAAATWSIFRYGLYSTRQSTGTSRDVFHHQRQAMLRNSASAAGAASQILKMLYGYRSYKLRAAARSLLYLLACAVIFTVWTFCGLYAPYVYTRTGSDVLLAESPYCGFALPQVSDSTNGGDTFNMFQKRDIDLVSAADAYVQQCYNESTTNAQCSTFPRRSLEYKKTVADCPFGTNKYLCVTINASTIQLDTGLLDSNLDFGINARQSEALKYRHVATCSPLRTGSAGFVSIVNTTGTDLESSYPPGETLYEYLYGPTNAANASYVHAKWERLYEDNYEITTLQYQPRTGLGDQAWSPNATLYAAQDADITISFLAANEIKYYYPVYDPVFGAGLDDGDTIILPNGAKNQTWYTSPQPSTLSAASSSTRSESLKTSVLHWARC